MAKTPDKASTSKPEAPTEGRRLPNPGRVNVISYSGFGRRGTFERPQKDQPDQGGDPDAP